MSAALLRKLSRWSDLTDADIELLTNLPGERRSLARGDCPLLLPGSRGRSLLMIDGWAARCKETANGRRVISEFLLPGDLQCHARHADPALSTVMLSAGEVMFLSQETLETLASLPRIGEALEWARTVQASIQREWLTNISANKVYARLAHLLCEISARMNSAGVLADETCAMPLTQADLADALSMTHAHCNIALQRLRSAELIRTGSKQLTILNRRVLESVAQFDDQYLLRWPTALPERRKHVGQQRAPDRRSFNR